MVVSLVKAGADEAGRCEDADARRIEFCRLYSMASVDGFIADRDGWFQWTVPSEDLFAVPHRARGRTGAMICGRRTLRRNVWGDGTRYAEDPASTPSSPICGDLPKIVFICGRRRIEGSNARLGHDAPVDEVAAAFAEHRQDVEIGGARSGWSAIERDLSTSSGSSAIRSSSAEEVTVAADIRLELLAPTFSDENVYEPLRIRRLVT